MDNGNGTDRPGTPARGVDDTQTDGNAGTATTTGGKHEKATGTGTTGKSGKTKPTGKGTTHDWPVTRTTTGKVRITETGRVNRLRSTLLSAGLDPVGPGEHTYTIGGESFHVRTRKGRMGMPDLTFSNGHGSVTLHMSVFSGGLEPDNGNYAEIATAAIDAMRLIAGCHAAGEKDIDGRLAPELKGRAAKSSTRRRRANGTS